MRQAAHHRHVGLRVWSQRLELSRHVSRSTRQNVRQLLPRVLARSIRTVGALDDCCSAVLLIKDAEMTFEAGFGRRSAQRQQPPPRQLQHYAVLLCHNGPFTQSVDPAITDSIWLPPLVLI